MLQLLPEIEVLLFAAIKNILSKPEILAADLHTAYAIYKDLKGTSNGNTESGNA
jgi:hypothetical protein